MTSVQLCVSHKPSEWITPIRCSWSRINTEFWNCNQNICEHVSNTLLIMQVGAWLDSLPWFSIYRNSHPWWAGHHSELTEWGYFLRVMAQTANWWVMGFFKYLNKNCDYVHKIQFSIEKSKNAHTRWHTVFSNSRITSIYVIYNVCCLYVLHWHILCSFIFL